MDHKISMKYKNIFLRPLAKKDVECLRQWRNNPEISKYLRKIPVINPEMQLEWFKRYLGDSNEMIFAIDETEHIREMVGSASLYEISKGQVEYGKIIIGHLDAHGKKIGKNTTKSVVAIAFKELNVNKVILHCFKSNLIALRVYDSVGFLVSDEYETMEGSEYLMELTKERFKELHKDIEI